MRASSGCARSACRARISRNLKQASEANQLVINRRIDPGMSEVFPWAQIPAAHEKMLDNKHLPGNMAVLVTAPKPGLRTVEDVLAVNGQG